MAEQQGWAPPPRFSLDPALVSVFLCRAFLLGSDSDREGGWRSPRCDSPAPILSLHHRYAHFYPRSLHGCNARGPRRSTAPAPAASRGPSSSLPSPYQAIAPLPWGLPNPARASRSTETVKLCCSHSGCSSKPPGELLKRPRPSPHCQRCFHRCWRRPRYVRF